MTEKKAILTENRACFRCTRPNHTARICRARVSCKQCKGRHATSVCRTGTQENQVQVQTQQTKATTSTMHATGNIQHHSVLLQTAIAWIEGQTSGRHCRLLLDSGSQRSFIEAGLAKEIGAKVIRQERLTIGSFGGDEKIKSMDVVEVTIAAPDNQTATVIEALQVDVISHSRLPAPNQSINEKMEQLQLRVADDRSGTTADQAIGMLVGSDYYWEFFTGRTHRLENRLMAVETTLGWVVQGPTEKSKTRLTQNQAVMVLKVEAAENDLQEDLQKFWNLESIGITKNSCNTAKTEIVEEFERKIQQRNGRYQVSLPWKESVNLETNKENAMKRLTQLTKRLKKNEAMLSRYDHAISEYVTLGVAEEVKESSETLKTLCYYMPHHAVIREDRATTKKIRVVLDASSHTQNGMSLNDNLEAGPNFNEDMLSLLINFRKEKVAKKRWP